METAISVENLRESMREDVAPEDQLCLLLARGKLPPDLRKAALELLASHLQWRRVLAHAYSHQIFPLLYRNLRALDFSGVPEAVRTELKGTFVANALRNKLLAEELSRLLRLMGQAGVPIIPLKGIPLAESLYGDAAFRVCADIDILVPPKNVTQALDLILGSGYRDDFGTAFFSDLALRHGRHYGFVREDRDLSCRLELHWKLVQNSSKNDDATKDLWDDARPKTFFGVPSYSLSPEWEFLYLAMHAADHQWQVLKWLVDIHEISLCGSLDWQKLVRKAQQFELDRVVRQTLTASKLLLGTSMPAGYSPAPLPARAHLFPAAPFPPGAGEGAFFHLYVLRRPLDKLRCVATILLVPKLTDRDFLRLPSSLSFLYYLMRPLRLTCKWSWRFLQSGFAHCMGMRGFTSRNG